MTTFNTFFRIQQDKGWSSNLTFYVFQNDDPYSRAVVFVPISWAQAAGWKIYEIRGSLAVYSAAEAYTILANNIVLRTTNITSRGLALQGGINTTAVNTNYKAFNDKGYVEFYNRSGWCYVPKSEFNGLFGTSNPTKEEADINTWRMTTFEVIRVKRRVEGFITDLTYVTPYPTQLNDLLPDHLKALGLAYKDNTNNKWGKFYFENNKPLIKGVVYKVAELNNQDCVFIPMLLGNLFGLNCCRRWGDYYVFKVGELWRYDGHPWPTCMNVDIANVKQGPLSLSTQYYTQVMCDICDFYSTDNQFCLIPANLDFSDYSLHVDLSGFESVKDVNGTFYKVPIDYLQSRGQRVFNKATNKYYMYTISSTTNPLSYVDEPFWDKNGLTYTSILGGYLTYVPADGKDHRNYYPPTGIKSRHLPDDPIRIDNNPVWEYLSQQNKYLGSSAYSKYLLYKGINYNSSVERDDDY